MLIRYSLPPSARIDLIEEAAFRRAEQAPGERAEQRRQIIGHDHHLLEEAPARHVGARDDPRHHEAEHQRHHGRGERDRQRVEDDLRIGEQAGEVVEAVFGRRPRLRVAGVERGLQQKGDRIEHEQARDERDERAGEGVGGEVQARMETATVLCGHGSRRRDGARAPSPMRSETMLATLHPEEARHALVSKDGHARALTAPASRSIPC